ncbi:Lrp/AsnC family transcriptional regulator for asnA, asnC and gidA [Amycolatopsis sulphurea]|uniref:Lrp/AsnC family transcriptional regulator for asnA, asnC and gidA n=1 Tax=Amycolatopsis sulphurea TaxID=76022 RepID=A0A2A9FBC5_9PSEU|nr:Lrp/AsnC family transcriptional regulator [Amycolatopsis sulphurea]PFG48654.1 Lrp/AsnC family transcriptional regulator for asnA, asnC and gidA [Amycolatopsis sulphurea]
MGNVTAEEPRVPRALDNTDRMLIALLQDDGRASFTTLAKSVGLSEGAVRQRVQRLMRDDMVRVVAVTAPERLDQTRQAMVGITIDGDPREAARQLAKIPQVHQVALCSGRFDVLAELLCRDDDHLLAVLADEIRAVPGVASTELFVYLGLAKQDFVRGKLMV